MTFDPKQARALVEMQLSNIAPSHADICHLCITLAAAQAEIERLQKSIEAMQAGTFYAQDDDGFLRRWYPPALEGADQ